MWSDPPATAEDWFCSGWCTDTGLERLNALLDDPANDTRPYDTLSAEANTFQLERYISPRLSPETLKTYPLDNATDPGFLRCEPWGVVRNVVARHDDPVMLREPIVLRKVWSWAPTAIIAPYTGCVRPTEFSTGK